MDFVGPIRPPSQDGNRYILTVSDYFTKFAWAKAMPTKEAVNVVSALKEVSTCSMLISIVISCWKTEEAVKSNIEQAQKKQKEYYDLKHGAAACFNVGSVVLKKVYS